MVLVAARISYYRKEKEESVKKATMPFIVVEKILLR